MGRGYLKGVKKIHLDCSTLYAAKQGSPQPTATGITFVLRGKPELVPGIVTRSEV